MTAADEHHRRGLELIELSKALRAAQRKVIQLRQQVHLIAQANRDLQDKVDSLMAAPPDHEVRIAKMAKALKAIREQRDGTLATNEKLQARLRELGALRGAKNDPEAP